MKYQITTFSKKTWSFYLELKYGYLQELLPLLCRWNNIAIAINVILNFVKSAG